MRFYREKYFLDTYSIFLFQVCQRFLLSTLGYSADSVLKVLFAKMTPTKVTPPASKRGKHDPKHKLQQETVADIKEHINKYNPSCSHYRRAHAPKRLYLPPELTIKEMHQDFCENGSGLIHYSTYAKVVQSMNIGFAKLGTEECETCEAYRLHEHDEQGNGPLPEVDLKKCEENGFSPPLQSCTKCHDWTHHLVRAGIGRKLYREDAKRSTSGGVPAYSADLQKVIMLPRLPGNKTAVFTRRIILFNETFAPAGGHGSPHGYLWHEGIRGRNDEDIVSTYVKFLERLSDVSDVVIWTDNCTAQNKNWTLYSGLAHFVNQSSNAFQKIVLRYFEKGHTFMSADSFHKNVEEAMASKKKLYDFSDFVECVNKHGTAIEMKPTEFMKFENNLNRTGKDCKFPHLADASEVCFIRGSTQIYWKTRHSDDCYQHGEFLKKKSRKAIEAETPIPHHTSPRGVNKQKQLDIIEKLSPVLPKDKLKFWLELPTNEKSTDLSKNYE